MRTVRKVILGLVVVAMAGIGALYLVVPEARWRVDVLALKATGRISDVSAGELLQMLKPGSGFYLESLAETRNPFSAIRNPHTSPGDIARGETLYGSSCVTCHGTDGVGSSGPQLATGNLRNGDSDWAMFRVIRDGVPGTAMPAHGLPDKDIWSLVAHLRRLQASEGLDAATASARPVSPVTSERLLNAGSEPANWLTYSGTYDGQRHSTLQEIDRTNAAGVGVRWIHQFSGPERVVEGSPIVNDGVMYVTESPSTVHALDAATGKLLWSYSHRNAPDVGVCCGLMNRGVAVHGDTVFLTSIDAWLIALDAATGELRWKVQLEDYKGGASVTGAPLVVGDKVIVGYGGGDMGLRGFLDAVSVKDGRRLWRFYTVPGPGEPGHESWTGDSWKTGGGGTWLTGVYDPKLNLLYWAVGNPGPDYQGKTRRGDNLYTSSVVALDPDTGTLKWHFQFTPHDERDWAANQMPALVDLSWQGRERQVILWANRNGFFYVLDRVTGEFLRGAPFAKQNWARGLDARGRPIEIPENRPDTVGKRTWPGPLGAASWQSTSFSPQTGLFYVPTLEWGQVIYQDVKPAEYAPRQYFLGGGHRPIPGDEALYFAVRALDPLTGKLVWEYRNPKRLNWWKTGGLVSTSTNIIFGGDDTDLYILDAVTGQELWRQNVGGRINASPVAYAVDGRQRFALAAGRSIVAVGLP